MIDHLVGPQVVRSELIGFRAVEAADLAIDVEKARVVLRVVTMVDRWRTGRQVIVPAGWIDEEWVGFERPLNGPRNR